MKEPPKVLITFLLIEPEESKESAKKPHHHRHHRRRKPKLSAREQLQPQYALGLNTIRQLLRPRAGDEKCDGLSVGENDAEVDEDFGAASDVSTCRSSCEEEASHWCSESDIASEDGEKNKENNQEVRGSDIIFNYHSLLYSILMNDGKDERDPSYVHSVCTDVELRVGLFQARCFGDHVQ